MTYHPKLTAQHFFIETQWEPYIYENPKQKTINTYKDCSTNELYCGDPYEIIRIKCFLLLIVSSISQSFAILYKMLDLIVKIMTLNAFFSSAYSQLDWLQKLNTFLIHILHFLMMPFTIIFLDLALLYGLFSPLDGRKLYSSLFILFYENTIIPQRTIPTVSLAPCFRPFYQLQVENNLLEVLSDKDNMSELEFALK